MIQIIYDFRRLSLFFSRRLYNYAPNKYTHTSFVYIDIYMMMSLNYKLQALLIRVHFRFYFFGVF